MVFSFGSYCLNSDPNTRIHPNVTNSEHSGVDSGHSGRSQGFTLIELLVVIFITGLLSAMVTVNFREQRTQQELLADANNTVSKIREVQGWVLSGREVSPGLAPDGYEIVVSSGSQNYVINYDLDGAKTLFETVSLSRNISMSQVYADNTPRAQITVRLEAPFGKVLVDGSANRNAGMDLTHAASSKTRRIIIDGISGRIGVE